MDNYQKFIATSRYCRWMEHEGRRETWDEAIHRYGKFFFDRVPKHELDKWQQEYATALACFKDLGSVSSMRALMTAGPALSRDNVAGYNCSYLVMNHPRAFDEMMYILMCGTGVGFSVERQYINSLPEVSEKLVNADTTIVVRDSKIGWATAYRELISLLYSGTIPKWDTSRVRPAGARLKTFGGRASGPAPLEDLFRFTVATFTKASGRKLNSLEVHDLCCKIAEIVVVGGVRRSALISLSNLSDNRMRQAKSGQWWEANPQRALANNSVSYTEKPDFASFLAEWQSLYESRSGERGMFSRKASQIQVAKNGRRDVNHEFGTNPCSEIILRPFQFCNLSEVVVRADDTFETLAHKVKAATIFGTLQSTLTNFRYLRPIWQQNTEEERLLGVSLTGIEDCSWLSNPDNPDLPLVLEQLKQVAINTNAEWADALGIPRSAAITCVKPSGTVSQLVDSASGIHPRFAPYYIRRVRADDKDPLSKLMVDQGVPYEVSHTSPTTLVFSFPQKAPKGSKCVADVGAIEQLKLWKVYQDHWCEHKPSITVYYKDHEFLQIGQWLWDNFDTVSGISFLPYSEHTYQQAPYEEITEEQYNVMLSKQPEIDFSLISKYELEDSTKGAKELACSAGYCEIVDL